MATQALAILCAVATPVHADADHAAMRASLEHFICPGYAHFAEGTEALNQSVAALCQKPSAAALKDTQKAFAATVEAWSMVEAVRFGPVAEQQRYDRIFLLARASAPAKCARRLRSGTRA
ncbi:MAG TPA: imelysin family protein [Methyloceanibacter sp.]|nr:imelysin family protein [Methyloceanibacter sp.]